MPNTKIEPDDWKRFFDDFSERHQSRLVHVVVFDSTGAQKDVRKMPLSKIVYKNGGENSSFLEIIFENRHADKGESRPTRSIPNVKSLFSKTRGAELDSSEAIEIEEVGGDKILLMLEKSPELRARALRAQAGSGLF